MLTPELVNLKMSLGNLCGTAKVVKFKQDFSKLHFKKCFNTGMILLMFKTHRNCKCFEEN